MDSDPAGEAAAPLLFHENQTLTEAQIAHEFCIAPSAVAFYARKGLLRPVRKDLRRTYSRDDHARLAFITQAKNLGFSLREISRMLARQPGASIGYQLKPSRAQCERKIAELDQQRQEIMTALAELRRIYTAMHIRVRSE